MKIFKHIGLLFLITVIGAIVVTILAIERANGRFTPWEFLGKPSGTVVQIAAPGYVITDTGDIYQYKYKKNCFVGCWDKVESVPTDEYPEVLPNSACVDLPFLGYFKQTKIICERWGIGSSLTVYGIGIDGFVYYWNYLSGEPIDILYSPFLGAAFGFFIGILAILLRKPSTWKDNARVLTE
jgi:hypothetical protein